MRRSRWRRKSSTALTRSSTQLPVSAGGSPKPGPRRASSSEDLTPARHRASLTRRARVARRLNRRVVLRSAVPPRPGRRDAAVSATPPASLLAVDPHLQRHDGAPRARVARHAGSGRRRARRCTRGGCSASARCSSAPSCSRAIAAQRERAVRLALADPRERHDLRCGRRPARGDVEAHVAHADSDLGHQHGARTAREADARRSTGAVRRRVAAASSCAGPWHGSHALHL